MAFPEKNDRLLQGFMTGIAARTGGLWRFINKSTKTGAYPASPKTGYRAPAGGDGISLAVGRPRGVHRREAYEKNAAACMDGGGWGVTGTRPCLVRRAGSRLAMVLGCGLESGFRRELGGAGDRAGCGAEKERWGVMGKARQRPQAEMTAYFSPVTAGVFYYELTKGVCFMMGYTHAAAGAVVGAAIGQIAGMPGFGASVGALAAVLPDMDHPGSIIGRRLRPASVLLEVAAGHRTITHTVWFCLGVGVLAGFAARMFQCSIGQFFNSAPTWLWFCAAVTGAVSHLLLDGLTHSGVEPFSPVLPFSLSGPVRTGGILELPITAVLLFALYRILF